MKAVEGVTKVVVVYDDKTATCEVDPAKFKKEAAIKALDEAGYADSTVVEPKAKS